MRIAVVGAGVSGLVAAWLLQRVHQVTVFEAAERPGGHAHTVQPLGGDGPALDTGFIVFNREDYPLFSRLLDTLGVAVQPSRMSFSVHCEHTGLEYCASPNPATLFAQPRNLARPAFHRMLLDIVRFYREAPALAAAGGPDLAVGDFLDANGYSRGFAEWHLLPMVSALWSASLAQARLFPVGRLADFMARHGMLRLRGRPQWLSVRGGSSTYVEALCSRLHVLPEYGQPVREVRAEGDGVRVCTARVEDVFDAVVFACHADQALRLLASPDAVEREVLGAFPYRDNVVTLHTDTSLLPRRRGAWGSWNCRLPGAAHEAPLMTYNLNHLQGLSGRRTYCVTLNGDERIDPGAVLGRYAYAHPQFDRVAFAAQGRWSKLQGRNRAWYCGAWWGYGFHEDGVRSAVRVAADLGVDW